VSRIRFNKPGLLCLLLVLTVVVFSGCATTEPENESVRPWNSPAGWEGGLPGGMMEGR